MNNPVVEVHVRAIVATSGGYAVFLGNEEKVFVILVDPTVGAAITMSITRASKERPLTHDLLANILQALGARTERVVVNDLKIVDPTVGAAITMSITRASKERPLTHDLLANILQALGARTERVVVNDL